jgi:hypothetical protein
MLLLDHVGPLPLAFEEELALEGFDWEEELSDKFASGASWRFLRIRGVMSTVSGM